MSKLAVYSDIIDRSLDRLESAIAAARAATYSPGQFTQDVSTSLNDWALLATLPFSVFGVDVLARPAIPTVEFIVTDKTVKPTVVVQMPPISGVTGTAPDNLKKPGGAPPFIASAKIIATLAGTEYLYVTLDSPTIPVTPANVYRGDIIGTPVNVAIAHVKVVWPG